MIWLQCKLWLFLCLDRLSRIRNPVNSAVVIDPGNERSEKALGYIWIYASTIGEVNAVKPLLDKLQVGHPTKTLVFLSNHQIYSESIGKLFPDSIRIFFELTVVGTEALLRKYPPDLFVVTEIPCMLSDAPCRLPFEVVYRAFRKGASLVAVNGWLYGDSPGCRMDAFEKWLFEVDYLKFFDCFMVQTQDVYIKLVQAGAPIDKVIVAGNIKWDLFGIAPGEVVHTDKADQIGQLVSRFDRIVTAGCIADLQDAALVVEGFSILKQAYPNTLLVIAPRHPESVELMSGILALICKFGLSYEKRSECLVSLPDTDILIIDTFGELRDFYAICNVTFVGRNHNLLEPLAFCKLVLCSENWEISFPSYPVYDSLLKSDLVVEVSTSKEFSAKLAEAFRSDTCPSISSVNEAIRPLRGSTEKQYQVLSALLAPPV